MASKRQMQDERADIERELYTHAGDTSTARMKELTKRREELDKQIKNAK